MINQYGSLTRSRRTEDSKTIWDPECTYLLNKLYINNDTNFRNKLFGWSNTSSNNCCYFYMCFNYTRYMSGKNAKPQYDGVPAYGVKGLDPIAREIKYNNLYLQRYEDVLGDSFVDYVFGTDYVKEEELQALVSEKEAVERLRREVRCVSHEVEDEERICRVMERIWDARERSKRTKVVLIVDQAEETSLDLLRQLYLLLPERLRADTGFATNIMPDDLKIIVSESLPICILTMDRKQLERFGEESLHGVKDPVEVLDLGTIELWPCEEKRLGLLRYHCGQLGRITELCVGYAERKVMEEEKRSSSSFDIYGRILEKTYSAELFWWKQKSLTTVEQIRNAYEDQRELMAVPELREEAVRCFYMEQMPGGAFAEQIVALVCDMQYPDREALMRFLAEELCYGKEMGAVGHYADRRDEEAQRLCDEHAQNMRAQEERLQAVQAEHACELQEKQEELRQLAEAKEQQRVTMEQTLAGEQQRYEEIISQRTQELEQLSEEKQNLQAQCKELQKRLKIIRAGGPSEREEALRRDYEDLNGQYNELRAENESLREDGVSLATGKKKAELVRNILAGVTAALVVAVAGVSVVGITKLQKRQAEYTALEAREKELEAENTDLLAQKETLESENTGLEKQIQKLHDEYKGKKDAEERLERESERESEAESEQEVYVPLKILY